MLALQLWTNLFIASIVLLQIQVIKGQLQCDVEGLCSDGSVLVDFNSSIHSYNDCLDLCKKNSECNWFSYWGSESDCLLFYDCAGLDSSYESTFSGEKGCPAKTVCQERGFCDGPLLGIYITPTLKECEGNCLDNDQCQWYSYFNSSFECFLVSDCLRVDYGCQDCTHSQRECASSSGFYTLLLAVGSKDSPNEFTAEIVDFSGLNRTCQPVADFVNNYRSVGIYMNNKAIVCGGQSPFPTDCYEYKPEVDTWVYLTDMNLPRSMAKGILLNDQQWWVTGDYYFDNDITTEIYYSANNSFENYIDLPSGRSHHNLVRIDDNRIMMLGDVNFQSEAWIFDQSLGSWIRGPDTLTDHDQPPAGLIKFRNGTSMVALLDYVGEYFNLDTETWNQGPGLPGRNADGCVAQMDDTFLVVGGEQDGRVIYKFDLDTETWITLPQQLSVDRQEFACLWVPDDFVTCT